MRVLQVVPYFFPAWSYGGIPRIAYGLSRELARLGHEVTVVTTDACGASDRVGPSRRDEVDHGVRVRRLPNLSNRIAYDHQLFLPRGAARVLGEEVPRHDVVHVHGHRHALEVLAARACRAAGIPMVLTANGTAPAIERKTGLKRAWDAVFGRGVLSATRAVTAVSQAEIPHYLKMGVPRAEVHLVPNGIDLAEFQALPPRGTFRARHGLGDAKVVLFLGKLTPRKGVDHLIAAHARLRTPGVALVVAGNDMGEGARLRDLAARSPSGDRVLFTGLLEGEERLAALRDADVLAYPGEHEVFGLVPFEGLLSGAPVVVADDCGCGELVEKARAGLKVRYGDPAELASRLDALLSDPSLGRAMVGRGRDFIALHLAWPVVAARTLDVYSQARLRAGRAGG